MRNARHKLIFVFYFPNMNQIKYIGTPLSPDATKVMLLGSGELGKGSINIKHDWARHGETRSNKGLPEPTEQKLPPKLRELFDQSATRLNLSSRAYHRVLKLSRTIADLENSENIERSHLMEALSYRPKQINSL